MVILNVLKIEASTHNLAIINERQASNDGSGPQGTLVARDERLLHSALVVGDI